MKLSGMDTTADASSAEATLTTADTEVPEVVSDAATNAASVVTDTAEPIGETTSATDVTTEASVSEMPANEDVTATSDSASAVDGTVAVDQTAGELATAHDLADEEAPQEAVSNDIVEMSYMLPNLARVGVICLNIAASCNIDCM